MSTDHVKHVAYLEAEVLGGDKIYSFADKGSQSIIDGHQIGKMLTAMKSTLPDGGILYYSYAKLR